jgi:D-apionate oxidoisomerase
MTVGKETDMERVAVLGAGGKMGFRIVRALAAGRITVTCVETGEPGIERLTAAGFAPVPQSSALQDADAVIVALPDRLIGKVLPSVVGDLRPGTMVVCLDPAAPYSGQLPERNDITYFVTHPCHPSIFGDEATEAGRRDHFGGIAAQAVVCALMQGPEPDYARGERIARIIFAPVNRTHRVTVEQMAILEPALSETLCVTLLSALRQGLDEAVSRGVPEAAARDFLLGHIRVESAILFNEIDARLSDGAIKAAERGASRILQPDWKRIFEPAAIEAEIRAIVDG